MKKIIKLSAFALISIVSLVGCSTNSGSDKPIAINPFAEDTIHKVETSLHDIDVKERSLPFCVNGETEYKIIIKEDNDYAATAALFIKQHVKKASDASLEVETYDDFTEYTPDCKYIVFGVDELAEAANVKKTTKDTKITGYQIVTKDNSVFIFVNHNYGYQQAAHCFLRYVVGYDRISEDICLYNRDPATLPEMNIVEVPDFQVRTQSNKVSNNYAYETGFLLLNDVFYSSSKIRFAHNCFDYVPTSLKTTHPKWFSDDSQQLCYTTHGDVDEYNALQDHVFEQLKTALADKPDCTLYAFSIEDNHGGCECEACRSDYNKYGAYSASIVKFINDLDDKVQGYLQEIADETGDPKRAVSLTFFAYNKVEKPPVKYDEATKTYVATAPEVVCHDTVSVYVAPIAALYQESFWNDANITTRETLDGWSAICKSICYWLYETNFTAYLYPYNSWANMAETYRYTVQKNAYYLFNEGQHNQGACTAFSRFKEYFNQVFEIDVNTDYVTTRDHFFKEYFGDASVPMYTMFDEIQQHMNFLKNEYYGQLTGQIYDQIAKSEYWPKQLLDRWVGFINEGFDLIKPLQYSDYAKYEVLYNNILLESIFPRYALLNHHSGKYSNKELTAMRTSFIKDAMNLGVTNIGESNGTISALKESWGV